MCVIMWFGVSGLEQAQLKLSAHHDPYGSFNVHTQGFLFSVGTPPKQQRRWLVF